MTLKWALRQLIKNGESSYDELREVLNLPSVRHLRDFKNAFKGDGEGVQNALLQSMDEEAVKRELTPRQRSGMLVWDAMKLSEGIVSNVFTGEIQGFEWDGIESFDHLSQSLAAMDKDAEGPESEPPTAAAAAAAGATPATAAAAPVTAAPTRKKKVLAKYWTEFFFRSGATTNFTYSVFRVGTGDLSAPDIHLMLMKTIVALDARDFQVIQLCADGASEHRAFQNAVATISVADVYALGEFGVYDGQIFERMVDSEGGFSELLHPKWDLKVRLALALLQAETLALL